MTLRWFAVLLLVACICESSQARLECIVEQAAYGSLQTMISLPDGNFLFNDLQYAIDHCPLQYIFIRPTTSVRDCHAIGCIRIQKEGPLIIAGSSPQLIDSGQEINRSTLLFNLSLCERHRYSVIDILQTQYVSFVDINIEFVSLYLPHNNPVPRNMSVVHVALSNGVTLQGMTVNLVVQRASTLYGWHALISLWRSYDVNITGCSLSANTFSDTSFLWDGTAEDTEEIQLFPNRSIPSVHLVDVEDSSLVCISSGSMTISSNLGRVFHGLDASNVKLVGVSATTILLLPTIPSTNGSISFLPAIVQREAFLFEGMCSGVMIAGVSLYVDCAAFCHQAFFPALISFQRRVGNKNTSLNGIIVRDSTSTVLTQGEPISSSTGGLINLIVVDVDFASCVFVSNVTFQTISLASTAVTLAVPKLQGSAVISVATTVTNGFFQTMVPVSQTVRSVVMDASDLLLSSDLSITPHIPFLQLTSRDVIPEQGCTFDPLFDVAKSSASTSIFQCCSVASTIFWSVLSAVLVSLSMVVFLLVRRRRRNSIEERNSDMDSADSDSPRGPLSQASQVGCDAKVDDLQSELSRPLLDALGQPTTSVAELSNQSSQATLQESEGHLSVRRVNSRSQRFSPRLGSSTQFQDPTGSANNSIPKHSSGINSDVVLYLPDREGWSSRSQWHWTPRPQQDCPNAQSFESISSLSPGRDPSSFSPAITLSPPKHVLHVSGTGDAVPFPQPNHRDDAAHSVHSSQYSSSTDEEECNGLDDENENDD